ncbi:MAG: serine hydrolase domain-containing protein [Bacteroidota bacterium]
MTKQFHRKTRPTQWHSVPILILLFVVLISSCRNRVIERGPLTFSERIDSLFVTAANFSGVVLVAENGKTVYHKAFGYRNFDTLEALDTASVFELASLSKQFTAMAVMQLKEEGKLSYDDPIEKFIPGLPYPGITVRHLLNHTSGLPDYQGIMDQYWDKSKVAGNADNIEYLIRYKPAPFSLPGEKYQYSNTGYMLLGSIVEKASGQDFIAFFRAHIFEPLQMTSTDIRTLDEKAKLPNMAWGHLWANEKRRFMRADSFPQFNYAIWLGNRKGPGRVSSTTSDLLKWDQALYQNKLVAKETLAEAFTPATLLNGSPSHYGFGWELQNNSQMGHVVRHSGSNPGYKTHIIRYIDQNKTIVLMSNNAHPAFEQVLAEIETILKKTSR